MWLVLAQSVACLAGTACGGGGEDGSPGPVVGQAPAMVASVTLPTPVAASTSPAESASATAPKVSVPAGPREGIAFTFTLPQARTTSAGVYKPDGTLVRTLWRGERLPAGSAARVWDQRDDKSLLVEGGEYLVRIIHHDVQYVWDGVVGNHSSRPGATALHKSFLGPTSLANGGGGRMHYVAGYNEAQGGIHGFAVADPQTNTPAARLVDPFVAATMVASDGVRLYWVNAGGLASRSFVAAFDIAGGRQSRFALGQPVCLNHFAGTSNCYEDQRYDSVLELRNNLNSPPTGLAVQKQGRLLAVSYGADNQVKLYDKTSGELLRTFSVNLQRTAKNQIAFAPDGDLWVIAGQVAQRFTSLESAPAVVASTPALVRPLAITVDGQDSDSVWIADGGSSQQLKRFDRFGSPGNIIGTAGGAVGQAAVALDRLCFRDGPASENTAVAVDDQRELWVVDSCTNRILHFNRRGLPGRQIAYLPSSYVAAADAGNPTRVFANYLEFAVDYSKPLSEPGAWTLVRNWLNVLPEGLQDVQSANRQWGGFRAVHTLANRRTYAQIGSNGASLIVELRSDGQMEVVRRLGAPGPGESGPVLYENGDIGHSVTVADRQTVMRLPLRGFDAQSRPVWATQPSVVASVPVTAGSPHHRNGTFTGVLGPRFPITDSGHVVFFDGSVEADSGFHLGAAALNGGHWIWQASPSGPLDGLGSFQTRKVDPAIQYGGNVVMASGRHLVYGFHGEFYTDLSNGRVGQANQFMHFRDDGLFVGQFGTPSTRATSPVQPGLSGNAFSPVLLRHAGGTYLYHNDESTHGGVHRWRLQGADDIRELVGRAQTRSAVELR